MRILAIVPSIYDTSPGQRFRIEQWEPLLRERGVEITYAPFENDELHQVLYQPGQMGRKLGLVARAFARRFSLLSSATQYDASMFLERQRCSARRLLNDCSSAKACRLYLISTMLFLSHIAVPLMVI